MDIVVLKDFWLPITVVVSPFISAWVMAYLTGRNRREEKVQDYIRQDAVAAQAAEAARLLSAATAKASVRAEEVASELRRNTTVTNDKLDVIHTLVNSNLTASMQSEYDATKRELAMMLEVIALKKAAGLEPSIDALAAVDATKVRIGELNSKLMDRAAQQQVVEKQLASKPDSRVGG